MKSKSNHILFWPASVIALIFFGLQTLLFINEWWTVAILKDVNNYPWGLVNENPWYYKNANIYSKVMLIEGLTMFIGVVFTIWFLTQRQKGRVYYSLLTCFLLFCFMIINSQIS